MAKLKVWQGLAFVRGHQVLGVVAATSQKKACKIVGCSIPYLRDYWVLTTKEEYITAAMAHPETLVVATLARKWVPADKWDYPQHIG